MKLKVQKRLAAQIMGHSEKKVWFDEDYLEEIKESITKADIRSLMNKGIIQLKQKKSPSRGRARERQSQKNKGRRKGHGKRKGRATARLSKKDKWKTNIRTQRDLVKSLKEREIISKKDYRMLYLKCKGGFFRSRRHIRLFIDEKGLAKKPENKQEKK